MNQSYNNQYGNNRNYPPSYGFQQPQPQQQQMMGGGQMQQMPFPQVPSGMTVPPTTGSFQGSQQPQIPGMLPIEQSYIENILRLNKGKLATVYATFENNREWNAKVFKGIIEAAGRDHVILSDPQTGTRYLLLMVYVDYITFDEEIEYEYPFGAMPGGATFSPR